MISNEGSLSSGLLPTASGLWVDPWAITVDQVAIEDLCFGLANECRWTSQIGRFYSVAQHSIIVSRHVPAAYAFAALLHDAAEAWLHDLAPQFWARFPGYEDAHKRAMDAVADRFDLPHGFDRDPVVARVDHKIRIDELRQLKGIALSDPGLQIQIDPWPPAHAAGAFLDRFFQLRRAR
jgi:hypothetical protein